MSPARRSKADGIFHGEAEDNVRQVLTWLADHHAEGWSLRRLMGAMKEAGWKGLRRPTQIRAMLAAHRRLSTDEWWAEVARATGYETEDSAAMAVRRLFQVEGRPAWPPWWPKVSGSRPNQPRRAR